MDRITGQLLKGYAEGAGLEKLKESQQFERFVAHIMLTRHVGGTFSADDFCVGDGVQGVDAAALAVNSRLIASEDDLEEVLGDPGPLSVDVVLIQVKTSPKFDLGPVSVFADTSSQILAGGVSAPRDVPVTSFLERIWEVSERLQENPRVYLYYVTTGKWESPAPIVGKMESTQQAIDATNLTSTVKFECWGASEVQKHWRAIDSGLSATFSFESRTTLPDMPGVEQSFLGYIPAEELLALVTEEGGGIRRALFFDNVRDFQGSVDVNERMVETLRSDDRSLFCVMNNGVTVVAKSLKTTGNKFTVANFQVVNGCQTSHILHRNRETVQGVFVPFRLIVTTDDEVAKAITTATNQQTQVSKENLLALSDVQKKIEQYLDAYKDDEEHRIYYERRSKQWVGSQPVRGAWRVISLRNLMQSFASIYMRVPHTASRYYRDLRQRNADEIFSEKHHPAYFYSAAYAYCKLDQFFRNGQLDRRYKPVRYHLLAGVRTEFKGSASPDVIHSAEKKAEAELKAFNSLLWNDDKYLAALTRVAELVDKIQPAEVTRDFGRSREQVDSFLDLVLNPGGEGD